ncbi:MAG TPA: hypothetical protein VG144_02305, partial [Gaiellaceae bacterium]|nr:hypothetical protein [Gaiellaceae bacterium]
SLGYPMSGVSSMPPEVATYLAAVRESLADLPPLERDDLLAEVEASLADAAAETGSSLTSRLGPPDRFAAELLAAAGLQRTPIAAGERSRLADRARALAARLAAHPRAAAWRSVARELAPIWWVARGYLVVGALAWALDNDAGRSTRYPIIPSFGSAEAGVALIAAAVALSVFVGLRMRGRRPRFPRLAVLVNVALALAAVPVALEVTRAQDDLVSAASVPPAVVEADVPDGLLYDGVRVTNVYPFSRDGRLLHDVLLYDSQGRPLELRAPRRLDPDRRVPVARGNRPVFNAFPIRYYEPGTRRVARPNAAPRVELPSILTPPVRPRGD